MAFVHIRSLFKKLFQSTDPEVAEITSEVSRKFEDTTKVAKRQVDLLRQNGVTMLIVIASGGDKHGH